MNDFLIVDVECVPIDDAGTFIEPVSAPSNYKDEAKIDAYIRENTAKAIERCGLDPDLCRVVALGAGEASGGDQVGLCRDETAEALALTEFWIRARGKRLVSFNGFGYDLPVLMRRSQYLDVDRPSLSLDRYRSEHVDLMQRLTWNGAIKAHSLKFYAKRFGLPINDEIDGSQIAELVRTGRWDDVAAHCRHDLVLTRGIAQKLRLLPMAVAA